MSFYQKKYIITNHARKRFLERIKKDHKIFDENIDLYILRCIENSFLIDNIGNTFTLRSFEIGIDFIVYNNIIKTCVESNHYSFNKLK